MSGTAERKRGIPTVRLALCALFAALTAVCSQIIIPIGPVPVSLSLLPVLLAAALLGWRYGALSMTVYLLMGLAGAPVFSGMSGGAAKLFGVTGGYILGYLPCAAVTGLLMKAWGRSFPKACAAMAVGVLTCYAFGTAWFMAVRGTPLAETLTLCVWPFLPFDAVKVAAAAFLTGRLEGPLKRVAG